MLTALFRSLKRDFEPKLLKRSSQCYYRAGINVTLRSVWCQRVALAQVEQWQHFAPGGLERSILSSISVSPAPNGSILVTNFSRLGSIGIMPTKFPVFLKMEEGKANVSVEVNQNDGGEAKSQEEEKLRLQKEQEKKKEEERKEKEIEDLIGPPPEKPLPGDCCGQGCDVCVWDTYWDELKDYKEQRKTAEEGSAT